VALAEREKDKVIQSTKKPVEQKDEDVNDQEHKKDKVQPQASDQTSNSIPFPSMPETQAELNVELFQENNSDHYGQGKQPWRPVGAYKDINEGLTAAIAHHKALSDIEDMSVQMEDDNNGLSDMLPPYFALLGPFNSEPQLFDEALHGPDAKWH